VTTLPKELMGVFLLFLCTSCHKQSRIQRTEKREDSDSSPIHGRSVDFYSEALQRPAHYLIALPPDYGSAPNAHFPVLFLLHGMDGSSADWISKGDLIQALQSHHFVAVMPDGSDSYYTNAALRLRDRYEDFITHDLTRDVEQHYRISSTAQARGIAGISMGGYGAVKIALRHPQMYALAAGLSSSLDAAQRTFSAHRLGQSLRLLRVFGPAGGPERRANDVFFLAQRTQTAPFIYLVCGTNEPLLAVNRSFARLLEKRGLTYEYHEYPSGEHSWESWKNQLPGLLAAAEQHMKSSERFANAASGNLPD